VTFDGAAGERAGELRAWERIAVGHLVDGDDAVRNCKPRPAALRGEFAVESGSATLAAQRAFAAGADIKEAFVTATPVSMLRQDLTSRWEAIRRIRTPIIAAVSGYALGGGCELAMICDIIVASETAQFGQPEINLGIIPGWGGTQRLTRTVGKYRANELILTGRRIKADEAKAIGLAAQVYPAASWLDDAKALARTIAEKAPVAARLATEAVDLAWNSTLDAGLEFERKAFYLLFATEDKKEGVDAFVNKRKASFKGR